MKALLQRGANASVTVNGQVTGKIEYGFVIFLGVEKTDTKEDASILAEKISKLRVFNDENGKLNLSIKDINGSSLIISQFTLCADYKKGNRPDYFKAASPETANELYEFFIEEIKKRGIPAKSGVFGADMQVTFTNDGPVTIFMDSEVLKKKQGD